MRSSAEQYGAVRSTKQSATDFPVAGRSGCLPACACPPAASTDLVPRPFRPPYSCCEAPHATQLETTCLTPHFQAAGLSVATPPKP